MKQLIKVVLPLAALGLLGGCGSQTKSHSDSAKTKTARVTKKAANHVSSTSDATSGKLVSSAASSAQTKKTSGSAEKNTASTPQQAKTSQAKANTNQVPKTAVTKAHLAVTQQSVASRISQSLSSQYKPQDLAFQFSQSGSGIYTVQVQENHQSPNMQAKGTDPSTSPTIAWFKTNASGQLLKSVDGGVNYAVVGSAY